MARLIEEARAAGYRRICGDTFATMDTALAMYRRMGFVDAVDYRSWYPLESLIEEGVVAPGIAT